MQYFQSSRRTCFATGQGRVMTPAMRNTMTLPASCGRSGTLFLEAPVDHGPVRPFFRPIPFSRPEKGSNVAIRLFSLHISSCWLCGLLCSHTLQLPGCKISKEKSQPPRIQATVSTGRGGFKMFSQRSVKWLFWLWPCKAYVIHGFVLCLSNVWLSKIVSNHEMA